MKCIHGSYSKEECTRCQRNKVTDMKLVFKTCRNNTVRALERMYEDRTN